MAEPGTTRAAVVAAVDIGTQSTRLLISRDGVDVDRRAVVTHLGRGVDRTGVLDPATFSATLDVLRDYRSALDAAGVGAVRAISTAVVRRVADPDAFLDAAAEVLGVRPELVPGDEEGRLAFAGATARLDEADGPFVTVDLGGGSTEFAFGTQRCDAVLSLPVGASWLTDTYLHGDPPRPEELTSALSVVGLHLDDLVREIPEVTSASTFLGLGGTFTTMAAVELGLAVYDPSRVDGFVLTRAAAEDVFRTLVTEREADRVHNPGLPVSRARTILGGSCAVVAVMRHFDLDSVRVSERDLLDGIVAELRSGDAP